MAWGFVQSNHAAQGAGGNLGLTLGTNIVSGHRLIVVVYTYGSGITLNKVSDNLGNQGAVAGQYDQAVVQPDPFNGHIYIMTVPITAAGACTLTATASASASFLSMWAGEYSGLSTSVGSAAWDVTASNNGTFALSMTSGTTASTAAANELAVAGIGWTDAAGSDRVTSGTGWTERFNASGVNGAIPLVVDDQSPSNGATVADAFGGNQNDAGNGYAAAVAVFKLAGAGPVYQRLPSGIYVRQAVNRAGSF